MTPTPEVRERLQQFRILQPLAADPAQLDAIAHILQPITYDTGDAIIRKGDIGDGAFLLVRGTVEVLDYTMDGEPYTRAVLRDSDSVIFGEMTLIRNDKRTATIIATTPCECWALTRDDFIALGDQNPRIGWQILRQIAIVLGERLEKTNQDVLVLFQALVLEIESETLQQDR